MGADNQATDTQTKKQELQRVIAKHIMANNIPMGIAKSALHGFEKYFIDLLRK